MPAVQTPVPLAAQCQGGSGTAAFKVAVAEDVLGAFKEICAKHGGPAQYLRHHFTSAEDRAAFAKWLWKQLPCNGEVPMHFSYPLPAGLQDSPALRVPVAALAFAENASVKPAPSAHLAIQLAEHILLEGFQTSGEPLLCKHLDGEVAVEAPWCQEAAGMPLPVFSLGYVKGAARGMTMLALLALLYHDDMSMVNEVLLRSLVSGVCVQHAKESSLQEEVLTNFRISIRGSLRRAPSLVTWVGVLANLQKHGYSEPADLIRKYNATVPKPQQLVGGRAVAVKNMLTSFPADALTMLMGHVSKHGWEGCAFTEDALSSRKILPDFTPRGSSKAWNARLKLDAFIVNLLFKRVVHEWDNAHGTHRKMDKQSLENLAEQAALLVNATRELTGKFPLPDAMLETLYGQWVQGRPSTCLQLQELLIDKPEPLDLPSIPCFRELVDQWRQSKGPLADPAAAVPSQLLQQATLEADAWTLVKRQLEYDQQAWRVFLQKKASVEAAVYHQRLEWRRKIFEDSRAECTQWFQQWSQVATYSNTRDISEKWARFEESVKQRQPIAGGAMVVAMFLLRSSLQMAAVAPDGLLHRMAEPRCFTVCGRVKRTGKEGREHGGTGGREGGGRAGGRGG